MYHQVFTEHSTGISQHSLKTLLQDLLLVSNNRLSAMILFTYNNICDSIVLMVTFIHA